MTVTFKSMRSNMTPVEYTGTHNPEVINGYNASELSRYAGKFYKAHDEQISKLFYLIRDYMGEDDDTVFNQLQNPDYIGPNEGSEETFTKIAGLYMYINNSLVDESTELDRVYNDLSEKARTLLADKLERKFNNLVDTMRGIMGDDFNPAELFAED